MTWPNKLSLTPFEKEHSTSHCRAIPIRGSRVQNVPARLPEGGFKSYCAQGAVKSLQTPRAAETTGVRLPNHRNTQQPASILHNETLLKECGPVPSDF